MFNAIRMINETENSLYSSTSGKPKLIQLFLFPSEQLSLQRYPFCRLKKNVNTGNNLSSSKYNRSILGL